jgi:orotidine-5'-phosphate decarboxylase
MKKIKKYSGNLPWLIPGVGFQGGSLEDSIKIGSLNKTIPIINVSRGIIYAGNGSIKAIRDATEIYTKKIRSIL